MPSRTQSTSNITQQNGTRIMTNTGGGGGIRGFDIGNNAKYAQAQQNVNRTNTLPSNFWEDESDSDSEEERKETQEDIVNRWKQQKSNIVTGTAHMSMIDVTKKKKVRHQRVRSMYDDSSSDDDDGGDDDDGFEKYVPPPQYL